MYIVLYTIYKSFEKELFCLLFFVGFFSSTKLGIKKAESPEQCQKMLLYSTLSTQPQFGW